MHPAKTNTATPPNITENAIIKSAISITLPSVFRLPSRVLNENKRASLAEVLEAPRSCRNTLTRRPKVIHYSTNHRDIARP